MVLRFFLLLGLAIVAILLFSRLKDWLSRRHDSHTPNHGDSGTIIEGSVVEPSPKVSHDKSSQDSSKDNLKDIGSHDNSHQGDASSSGSGDGDGGGD